MNNTGKMVINSEDINNSISALDECLLSLEDLNGIIPAQFLVFKELAFFDNGLSKISNQITTLSTYFENLMTKIAVHAKKIQEQEARIAREAENYSTQQQARVGSYLDNSYAGVNISVNDVNHGISINNGYSTQDVVNSIKLLDDAEKIKLIEFINANKGNISLLDLFNKKENSITLVKLLRNFYGDSTEIQNLEIEEANLLRTELTKILNTSFENSKIILKDVLTSVSAKENLLLNDLLTNSQYTDFVKNTINDLYIGKNLSNYNISVSQSDTVKLYIDFCAKNSNATVEQTIINDKFLNSIMESR